MTRPATSERVRWRDVSKTRAFLTHLALSGLAVGTVVAIVFTVWYPGPFFEATGTSSVLRVLISVDLIVGPTLTAIVFKPGKPGLTFDLCVIATIQITALAYGVTVLYQERPYYMVFALDRFHILAHKDVWPEGADKNGWDDKPWIGPRPVFASIPTDVKGQQRLLEETVFEGKPDIEQRPEFWSPYAEHLSAVEKRAEPIEKLRLERADLDNDIDAIIRDRGESEESLGWLPVVAKHGDMTAVIDRDDGSIVAVLDVEPWPLL
jgi:hypothetical protein